MEILKKRTPISNEILSAFQLESGFDKNICELLLARGIDSISKINDFFNPNFKNTFNPFEFLGMNEAKKRILLALENNENIVIYGDYDCDGMTAVAMLYLALEKAGANVFYYIPDRHNEGYGINIDSVAKIAETFFPDLIITVDCGITAVSEAKVIQEEMGIDIIITDHHEPKSELPSSIIINPKLDKSKNAPDLCGAGVALKLIEAVFGRQEAENYLDLASLATIADMVELTGDNRTIAALGIDLINNKKARPGINLLVQKISDQNKKITASDISFKIAPRLNASGRISSADKAVELFISEDRGELLHIITELERDNFERQQLCSDVVKDATEILNNKDLSEVYAIVLANPLWDAGIVGIAAAKIAEEYMRPTVLLTSNDGNTYKGSARSIKNIDLFDALNNTSEKLIAFGGHKAAAGLSINKCDIEYFSKSLSDYIKNKYSIEDFVRRINYDLEMDIKEISLEFIKKLERFEPFGMSNPKPVFISKLPENNFMKMKNGEHFRMRVNGNTEMVAFNFKNGMEIIKNSESVMISYSVEKEIFQNKEYIKGYIKDAVNISRELKTDYLCASVLDQARYDSFHYETLNNINDIDIKPFGTLLVAFSNQALSDFSDICITGFIGIDLKQSNLTRVYSGSLSSINLSLYNNIVFLEKPLSGGYIQELKKRSSANIYVLNNENSLLPLLKTEIPERDDIALVYKRLKQYENELFFDGVQTLFDKVFSDKKISFIKFCACFYILFELKLILVYNSQKINISNEKTDLDNSNIYRFLKSL